MTLYVLRAKKKWFRKVRYWIIIPLVLILLLFLALRLALNPIIDFMTANGMGKLQGYRGTYQSVSFSLLKFRYVINNLKVEKTDNDGFQLPLASINRIEVSFSLKDLVRGSLVARMRIEKPVFAFPLKEEKKPPAPRPGTDISAALRDVMPFSIERIEIMDGEMHLIDTGPGHEIKEKTRKEGEEKGNEFAREQVPEILLSGIEVTIENLHTRTTSGEEWPTVIATRAMVGRSGVLTMFVTADLLAERLTFAGQSQLIGLDLADLNPVIEKESSLKVNKGTFDLFTAFQARNGLITGGVRPLIKDADLERVSSGMILKLKEVLIDTSLTVLSDRVPGRRAVAATIPIQGKIRDPGMQFLPALLGVLRNAFVEGLTESLNNLPPPQAKTREGTLTQATEALTPGAQAPKAQPEPGQLPPMQGANHSPPSGSGPIPGNETR